MGGPINREFPLHQIQSLAELVEIALGMEMEAASRYAELAQYMTDRGELGIARTFARLAEMEKDHGGELRGWAARKGLPDPSPRRFTWKLPETFSLHDAEGAKLSPYLILSIAVRNEELAFAFYTYAAAMAEPGSDIRACSESFAREELNHMDQLRKLRRQAFHDGGRAGGKGHRTASTRAELRRLAWDLEMGSAELLAMAARRFWDADHPETATLLAQASEMALGTATGLAERGSSHALPDEIEAAPSVGTGAQGARSMSAEDLIRSCERDAQDALELYLATADKAADEPLLQQAQSLAESAMARLALIRSLPGRDWGTAEIAEWE